MTDRVLEGARRAASWLARCQTERGNYVGRETPNADGIYPDMDDVACYYKSFYFLRVAGEARAAARGLAYVVERFMTPDGDFVNSETLRSSGSYSTRFCHLYPNAFLLCAAVALNWHDLARQMLRPFLATRDPETGGFFGLVTRPCTVLNSDSTALGAFCCLQTGRIDMAVSAGDFLLRLLKEQPDPTRLYGQWEAGTGFVTDADELSETDRKAYYIDGKAPEQFYWLWGWPLVVLVQLYQHTAEERFQEGARDIYRALCSCQADAFGYQTSGKAGWASAMLYRMTGEKHYLRTALSQMEFILSRQHADGYMLSPGAECNEDQPARIGYDFTADFGTWLVDTAVELCARGAGAAS